MGEVCGVLLITFSREHILCVNNEEYHLCCSVVYCGKIIHKTSEMMYVKLISYNMSPHPTPLHTEFLTLYVQMGKQCPSI